MVLLFSPQLDVIIGGADELALKSAVGQIRNDMNVDTIIIVTPKDETTRNQAARYSVHYQGKVYFLAGRAVGNKNEESVRFGVNQGVSWAAPSNSRGGRPYLDDGFAYTWGPWIIIHPELAPHFDKWLSFQLGNPGQAGSPFWDRIFEWVLRIRTKETPDDCVTPLIQRAVVKIELQGGALVVFARPVPPSLKGWFGHPLCPAGAYEDVDQNVPITRQPGPFVMEAAKPSFVTLSLESNDKH